MSRTTRPIRDKVRAEVLAAVLAEGLSIRAASERFGISKSTVARLKYANSPVLKSRADNAAPPPPEVIERPRSRRARYQSPKPRDRSVESLSELIYDAVEATIHAIIVRAQLTEDKSWLAGQSGEDLARLDETQWNQVARFVGGFRTVGPVAALPPGETGAAPAGEGAAQSPTQGDDARRRNGHPAAGAD